MELEMGLAVLGVVAATAVAVYLVSVMGIKEKSFEEAIAEQKKRSEDLLGRKDTKKKVAVKDKNKKQKKAKEKEKSQVDKEDLTDGQTSSSHHHEEKHHVEIVAEPEILDDTHLSESRRASVIRVRDSENLKSILVNKEEHSPVVVAEVVEPANHFEELHPKDEMELLKRQASSDELSPPMTPPPLPQKPGKKNKRTEAVMASNDNNMDGSGYYENYPVKEVQEEVVDPAIAEQLGSGRSYTPDENQNDGKQGNNRIKKGKKVEDRDVLTAAKLESFIEKVSLSSFEIQNLIDTLLNKQHAGDSDWVNKGKTDNVGSLKKQLSEREKQLSEEQLASQQLQTKLRDLRQEYANEKSKYSHHRRQLEEALTQKDQMVQQISARVQQSRQEASEKHVLQQQFQQLQITLTNTREENAALKNALTVEQSGRSKADSLEREAEALRTQCGHLEKQLNAAFQSNQELSNQIRSLTEHMRALEELKKQEELNMRNQYASQMQEREVHLLGELKKAQDLYTDAEQDRINLRQQISNLQNSVRSSQDAAKTLEELTKKLEESHKAEMNTKNLLEDSKSQFVALRDQLQANESNLGQLGAENKKLSEQIVTLTAKQEAAELEKEKLSGDLKSQQINSSERTDLESKLADLQNIVKVTEAVKKELEERNTQLSNEIGTITHDLNSQKDKNNELRVKNTKLLDTLNITEKNLETHIVQSTRLIQEEKSKTVDEVETRIKCTLKNELPHLSVNMIEANWAEKFAEEVKKELEAAKSSSGATESSSEHLEEVAGLKEANEKLKVDVAHYQSVLASTESLLSNLQASIEKEERKWHTKVQQLQSEVNTLREETPSEGVELTDLKKKLVVAEEEKSVVLQRCSELEINIENLKKQFAQVEGLQTKVQVLEKALEDEKNQGAELNTEKLRLEALVIKEQELKSEDKERVQRLEAEIASLKKQISNAEAQAVNSPITVKNGVTNGKVDESGDAESLVAKKGENHSSATTPSQHASNAPSSTSANTTPVSAISSPETPVSTKETKPKKKKKKKKSKDTMMIETESGESGEPVPEEEMTEGKKSVDSLIHVT